MREGYREVRSRAWVWATLASFCVALFFAFAPLFVLGPIVAREQYGDLAVFGYVFAASAPGRSRARSEGCAGARATRCARR